MVGGSRSPARVGRIPSSLLQGSAKQGVEALARLKVPYLATRDRVTEDGIGNICARSTLIVLSAEQETRRCPSSWQPFTAAV